MSKHTPGNLHIENKPTDIWDERGLLLAIFPANINDEEEWDRRCKDAARVVAVWNALAGVENPAAFVKAAREAVYSDVRPVAADVFKRDFLLAAFRAADAPPVAIPPPTRCRGCGDAKCLDCASANDDDAQRAAQARADAEEVGNE